MCLFFLVFGATEPAHTRTSGQCSSGLKKSHTCPLLSAYISQSSSGLLVVPCFYCSDAASSSCHSTVKHRVVLLVLIITTIYSGFPCNVPLMFLFFPSLLSCSVFSSFILFCEMYWLQPCQLLASRSLQQFPLVANLEKHHSQHNTSCLQLTGWSQFDMSRFVCQSALGCFVLR